MDPATIVQIVSLGISALSVLAAAAAHYRINRSSGPAPAPSPSPSPVAPPVIPPVVPAPTPTDPIHPDHPVLQGLLQAVAILQQAFAQQGAIPLPPPAK
jgi:hypothetical protein